MKSSWILALQFSFIGLAPNAFCQALEKTTALLNDPVARNKLIQKDPGAKAADEQVQALGLSAEGQEKIYRLSGKIFEKMTESADGNVDQLSEQVQNLVRNPSALEKVITPDQKAEIHDLANGVTSKPELKR